MLFNSFEEFLEEIGPKPSKHHTVDRIENDGHYAPGNVRWLTRKEQAINRGRKDAEPNVESHTRRTPRQCSSPVCNLKRVELVRPPTGQIKIETCPVCEKMDISSL